MAAAKRETDRGLRVVGGIVFLALCVFTAIALFSYDWRDIALLHVPPNSPPCNLIGPVGAWLSFMFFVIIGVGAYLVPLYCFIFGLILIFDNEDRVWPRSAWLGSTLLCMVAILELNAVDWIATCGRLNIVHTGGLFGRLLIDGLLIRWLSPVGTGILVTALLLASLILLIEMRHLVWAGKGIARGAAAGVAKVNAMLDTRQDQRRLIEKEERQLERQRKRLEKEIARKTRKAKSETPEPKPEPKPIPEPKPQPPAREPKRRLRPVPAPVKRKPVHQPEPEGDLPVADAEPRLYTLPPISLLDEPVAAPTRAIKTDTATTARILMETLSEFGIETEVTNIEQGPVVTSYELLPAPGIRVERINGLSNNLALSLKATSVRVQAPIPGKGVVGIEVPNATSKMVALREIMEGENWAKGKAELPLVLGQDVGGNDQIADLARMPHMLIAGATGAGKTVCMNSILAGLLMSRTPDELKLMLVDPKIVEFAAYADLPHLVVPVITDAKKVALGLRWAIKEMERRYKLFAKVGVRNIASFNSREKVVQGDLFGGEGAAPQEPPAETVPYIVIVIDELADLMLADKAEIENCIARLAQLSRAVGIHMILATQRPSVNVITGTIKANFPARLAFQVAQRVDSRTILDSMGAEKLLGRGDMLFLPPGTSKLVRAQGAMTSDDEILRITNFIREQAQPEFEMEIKSQIDKKAVGGGTSDAGGGEDDELLEQAVAIIRETQRASTSSLQRRLRIGYNRAGRLMDALEERGIIGPPRGSDPREILIDLDVEIPDNPGDLDEGEED
jgi:S-DNA-T family DNA segregation ATPase FtsK/SpoIIIE